MSFPRVIRLNVKVSGYTGLSIIWDNEQLVQVIAPSSLKDSLCGLCGTFNDKSSDDFVPKDSIVYEDDLHTFALSWQTDPESCDDSNNMIKVNEVPCDYSSIQVLAEENCNVIKTSPSFQSCHETVDVTEYYNRYVGDKTS